MIANGLNMSMWATARYSKHKYNYETRSKSYLSI